MENIIKKVIDIENTAKNRLNEINELKQKNKDECRVEFKQIRQTKYNAVNDKINAYRNERKKILDMNIKKIESEQEKINKKLVSDFNNNYDKTLESLYDKIIG